MEKIPISQYASDNEWDELDVLSVSYCVYKEEYSIVTVVLGMPILQVSCFVSIYKAQSLIFGSCLIWTVEIDLSLVPCGVRNRLRKRVHL